jgi:hypothetical protein
MDWTCVLPFVEAGCTLGVLQELRQMKSNYNQITTVQI